MDYESMRAFADTWGLVFLFVLFLGVLVYALWPGNRKRFEEDAQIPLKED